MPAPTQAEANAWAGRSDNFGKSLKSAEYGGPAQRAYNQTNPSWERVAQGSYQVEHPRYPDYLYPDDKDADTYMMAKRQMVGAGKPLGEVFSTDRDIQYLINKKNAQELTLFKAFVEDSIPRGTPWARDFFEKIMPGWYQSKIDIIQDKLAIVNRFIDMSIRGPQNIDDMFLLYQLYTGKISIPENWNQLIHGSRLVNDVNFSCGLFNPKRWITASFRLSKRNQEFLANFAIPGVDAKGLGNIVSQPHNTAAAENDFAGAATTPQLAHIDADGFWGKSMFGIAASDEGLLGAQGMRDRAAAGAAEGFANRVGNMGRDF